MSISLLFPLISAIFVFALGLLVFFKNPKNRLNWTFALESLATTVWLVGAFMMFISRGNNDASIFWDRFIYGGVVFVPAFMYHFGLALTKRKADFFLYLSYALSIFFLIISRTDYFVTGIFVYTWGVHTQARIFHHIFLLYFAIYAVTWFIQVYRYYRKEESTLTRYQIKYFFIAFLILFTIGPTAYLPAYGVSIYPFSFLSGLFFTIIISYAILRYRLMDMRIIARTFLIYALDSTVVYVFFNLLVASYIHFFGSVWTSEALFIGVFVAPVFIGMIFNFDRLIKYLLDRYFFYSLYDFRKTITKLSTDLNSYTDLDKIVELIVDTIKNTMGLNRAGVLIIDKAEGVTRYKIAKVTGFDITNGISLVKDNFLTKYLKQTAKPLVREELSLIARDSKNQKESKSFLNLEKEMAHIEASLCLPLLLGKELRGIIVLGVKNSGDPYTQEDLNLLLTLSNQAAVAIDNARLYSETKNFNKLLQSKVDEQTTELKKRAEHLEKLLKMREEFLDIASHQLKTPVSVIRGTISMFRDGSMDKLSKEEQRKFMDNIYHKTEKLNVIISDILRASEIDSEEFKIDPKTTSSVKLADILKSVVDDLKELAQDKGIALELKVPVKLSPYIATSADFLEQAIYNLVDNAIKYTAKGFVKIELEAKDNSAVIRVIDNGIGIPAGEQKKMFEKFSRAKNAVNMYTDGSGLGLFIVKRIVEAHQGGKIEFKSEEGKGTTFTVTLPAVKK